MNDDKLLRARAEDAESELEEERRYCGRCYDLHRHTLTALQAKLAELERERDEARDALDWCDSRREAAEQDAARLARALDRLTQHQPEWCGWQGDLDESGARAALAAHEERVGGAR